MLPRGIQVVRWKNADKTKSIRYRVRISRKDFKEDKLFIDIEEAKEYLNLSKTKRGKEQIYKISEEQQRQANEISEFLTQPPFSYYVNKYIKEYIDTQATHTELQKRNIQAQKSFFNTILKTKIEFNDVTTGMLAEFTRSPKVNFSSLKLKEITSFEINQYINERLKTVKKISVSRELNFISKVFQKLKHLDRSLVNYSNPVLSYDKDLLKHRTNKKEFRLTQEDSDKLFKALETYPNPHFKQIINLALLTSMRRSEIITLTWAQLHDSYIHLDNTKSGKPRKVYLTKESRDYINTFQRFNNKMNLFDYKISGFEGSFYKFMERINLSHISFHCFRKESISRFIEKLGGDNSILLTTILGITNIRKFEETYDTKNLNAPETQEQALKSIGHSSPQVTKDFYYSVKKTT